MLSAIGAFGQATWIVDDDAPGDPGPGDPTISDPLENGLASSRSSGCYSRSRRNATRTKVEWVRRSGVGTVRIGELEK